MKYISDGEVHFIEELRAYYGYRVILNDTANIAVCPIKKLSDEGLCGGINKINNSVIEEAVREGLITKVSDNRGLRGSKIYNEYYKFIPRKKNPYDSRKSEVTPHNICIVTMQVYSSKQKTFCIIDGYNERLIKFLSRGSVYLTAKGKLFSNVRHTAVVGHPEIKNRTSTSLATVVSVFSKNRSKYDCSDEELMDICLRERLEGHHVMSTVDNRAKSVLALSPEDHRKLHKIIGSNGHRLDAEIKTFNELNTYIKFLESDKYRCLYALSEDMKKKISRKDREKALRKIEKEFREASKQQASKQQASKQQASKQ